MAITATENLGNSRTSEAFATAKRCVTLFGAIGLITLATLAVMAAAGHGTTPFMWIRGVIFPALAPVLLRLTTRAAGGDHKALDRIRTVSTVMPFAVLGVDLIPGICPAWYAVLQGLSALAILPIAILTRTKAVTAAFPKP
ncbi:hypothetical protein [Streptomyces sp. CBMA123]|uniref:hypothetical protein n=1 Tax=Streptomyces sp. CBMA123 TaxID=1896313 RepID=UPI001661AE51|nr:hypothetical protein [Streptomyces sp. CBMA123]MBD0691970.1 hypothetical protein [Streptomyces sp. CBMA123]